MCQQDLGFLKRLLSPQLLSDAKNTNRISFQSFPPYRRPATCTYCAPSQSAKARPPLLLSLLSVPSFHFPGALLPPPLPSSAIHLPLPSFEGEGGWPPQRNNNNIPASSFIVDPLPRPLSSWSDVGRGTATGISKTFPNEKPSRGLKFLSLAEGEKGEGVGILTQGCLHPCRRGGRCPHLCSSRDGGRRILSCHARTASHVGPAFLCFQS